MYNHLRLFPYVVQMQPRCTHKLFMWLSLILKACYPPRWRQTSHWRHKHHSAVLSLDFASFNFQTITPIHLYYTKPSLNVLLTSLKNLSHSSKQPPCLPKKFSTSGKPPRLLLRAKAPSKALQIVGISLTSSYTPTDRTFKAAQSLVSAHECFAARPNAEGCSHEYHDGRLAAHQVWWPLNNTMLKGF